MSIKATLYMEIQNHRKTVHENARDCKDMAKKYIHSMRKSVYFLQGKTLIRNDLSSLLIQLSILRNMSSILNEGAKGSFREVDNIGFL